MIKTTQDTLRGALWMGVALCCFCSMAVAGRELAGRVPVADMMSWRAIIGLGGVVAWCLVTGTVAQLRTQRFLLHFLRNLGHFSGQFCWYSAVAVLPMATLFAYEFTSPLWVLLLSPLVLGEKLTGRRALAATLGFVGVLIVARPLGAAELPPGSIWAALCAIGFAVSTLGTKLLTRTETLPNIMFWLCLIQLPFSVVLAGGLPIWPQPAEWPWVLVVAIGGFLAHLAMARAFQLADALTMAPIDFARLPLIAMIGMGLYGEQIDIWVFVGALIIFAGNWLNLTGGRLVAARNSG